MKCTCSCHREGSHECCCECKSKPCSHQPQRRCCGDPDPPGLAPETPRPGWQPSQQPANSPWKPNEPDGERWRRFPGVLLEEVRRGSGPKGPVFGKRKNELLPYLVVRAGAGDHGQRPWAGSFWESPDIFVVSGMNADVAPAVPPQRGASAIAGQPTTLWAHVWNLGRLPVANARVEFYWCDPSLGISTESAALIGVAHVDLGNRESGRCHTFVKCPTTWIPTVVNGGHECLVVRAFEPLTDSLLRPGWSPWLDRHVGQRNITVITASSPARALISLRLGCNAGPGLARVMVERVRVEEVGWVSLLTGRRGERLREAQRINAMVGLLPVTLRRNPYVRLTTPLDALRDLARLLRRRLDFERTCDELETQLVVDIEGLQSGEYCVYRVIQKQRGTVLGGYTVIAHRPQDAPD
jgi:hypothetical protein